MWDISWCQFFPCVCEYPLMNHQSLFLLQTCTQLQDVCQYYTLLLWRCNFEQSIWYWSNYRKSRHWLILSWNGISTSLFTVFTAKQRMIKHKDFSIHDNISFAWERGRSLYCTGVPMWTSVITPARREAGELRSFCWICGRSLPARRGGAGGVEL